MHACNLNYDNFIIDFLCVCVCDYVFFYNLKTREAIFFFLFSQIFTIYSRMKKILIKRVEEEQEIIKNLNGKLSFFNNELSSYILVLISFVSFKKIKQSMKKIK